MKKLSKKLDWLKNTVFLRWFKYRKKFTNFLPPENVDYKKSIIAKQFANDAGYYPNFENPRSLNEKIQWLKLYYRDDLMTKCADKYAVREYIGKTAGEEFLTKLLGVYEKAEDIRFNKLPEKFVLKANNTSGADFFCRDKSKLNRKKVRARMKKWLDPKANHYYYSFEWVYKNIKPKIICEELIESLDGGNLKNYDFACFNGKAKFFYVTSEIEEECKTTGFIDRSSDVYLDLFDMDWNRLPFTKPNCRRSEKEIKKPENFSQMVELAEKLAKPFPFVRVDLHEASGGKILFGELTFYPANGLKPYTPEEWDYKLGEMLVLPRKNI